MAWLFCTSLTFAGLLSVTFGYVDFGKSTLEYVDLNIPTPTPNQIPIAPEFYFEPLPSMITAVAPTVTIAANGSRETIYSLYHHELFKKTRQGRGVFNKRGVFDDSPIVTCTPCGGDAGNITSTVSSVTCRTVTYTGVFQFPDPRGTTTEYCYDTNYSGVFKPGTAAPGLPCCFTIPESCRINATSSTSFAYSTGVFASSTTMAYMSNMTSTRSSTLSPSSSVFLSTPSRTESFVLASSTSGSRSSSSSSSRASNLSAISGSATVLTTITVISGTSTNITLSSSLSTLTTTSETSSRSGSAIPYVSVSSSTLTTPDSLSVIVVSSTTITVFNPSTSIGNISTRPSSASIERSTTATVSGSTITVITVTPSTTSHGVTTEPNAVIGCGTVTGAGSGTIIGSGTFTVNDTSYVVSSTGTTSGYATRVVGCGTIIATTGTFIGNGTATGCGEGSGLGTLTGAGTVWPDWGGGVLSLVTTGTVTASGSFRGCGTLTGSGTFIASPIVRTTSSRPTRTVEVYVSHCPDDANDNIIVNVFGAGHTLNISSSLGAHNVSLNTFHRLGGTNGSSSANSSESLGNPLCHVCPESVGICCPPGVACDAAARCPWDALVNARYTLNGFQIVQVANSSVAAVGSRSKRGLLLDEKRQQQEGAWQLGTGGNGLEVARGRVYSEVDRYLMDLAGHHVHGHGAEWWGDHKGSPA